MNRYLERLRPHQIRAALAEHSVIWFPLGTIEWHCEHLPVGLDGLTAQALCHQAAERAGGLVLPPLFIGTGGGHGDYPWTLMMQSPDEIAAIIARTATRLQSMNVAQLVLFSGHFAEEQLAMIDTFAADWNAADNALRITATAVNRCSDAAFEPDHAGAFETTLMNAIAPETVALSRLPALENAPDTRDRHDPNSPIWGVIGADPRLSSFDDSPILFDRMAKWLAGHAS